MASAPSDPRPVLGRLDSAGRLIAADPALERLQRDAGASLGQALALPQIAEIAELARTLGTPVQRPAIAASADQDIDLWVHAVPEGEEVALSLEGWTVRPPSAPRLAAILAGRSDSAEPGARFAWAVDQELRLMSVAPELAQLCGMSADEAAGSPLTRLVRLEEDDDGTMSLLGALAARSAFSGQRARTRGGEDRLLLLSGEPVTGPDGSFAGFRGSAVGEDDAGAAGDRPAAADPQFDALLRLPIDRIITSAEQILARADGPLKSEYAAYGNDIASAARHLMSVLQGMGGDPADAHAVVDLAALSAEAVVMLESSAEERGVAIELVAGQPHPVFGEERAIIQIVVNLISNALRHSPRGGIVRLTFSRTEGSASLTVTDQGPGIAAGDEERIFERFERSQGSPSGTGLGLAISRRLARSMDGDVTLDSAPGEGARFTLTLRSA